jgi:hypothetical protein
MPPHLQDRSDKADLGTQAFFGNFNTFETLSIFKQQQPENAAGEHAPAVRIAAPLQGCLRTAAVLQEVFRRQPTHCLLFASRPNP